MGVAPRLLDPVPYEERQAQKKLCGLFKGLAASVAVIGSMQE